MIQFGVILADPPWAYRNRSSTLNGAAQAHYSVMSETELAAIPVASWAAPSCVLALWATWPKLDVAFQLIDAWGFHYITGAPWVKTQPSNGQPRMGVGFWFRGATELLLIATRGHPERMGSRSNTPMGLLVDGDEGEGRVFWAHAGPHSRKPMGVQDWLECTLLGPYLELFACRERVGWTCWGLDVGWVLTTRGVEPVTVRDPGFDLADFRRMVDWCGPTQGEQ